MIFSERRLAVALSVFLLTVFFLCVLEYKFITAAAIALFLLVAAFIALLFVLRKPAKNKIKTLCGYALLFVSSAFAAVFFCIIYFNIFEKPVLNHLEKYKDEPVYIKAEIIDVSGKAYYSSFALEVFEMNGEKINKFNLLLDIYGEIGAGRDEIGDILETYVILKSWDKEPLAGLIAYNKSCGYYIAAEHAGEIAAIAINEENDADGGESGFLYKITPPDSRSLNYYLESIRQYTGDVFFKHIRTDIRENRTPEAAVVYGIFTGNKNYISTDVRADFKKAGIAHVLSVSGLHLAILCGMILKFLNFLKINKKIICVTIILCCLAFMAFTGFSLSVIRSGIMMILFYAAYLIGRKSDGLTSLLAAGAFIIILNPYNILHIGFQLSFLATLGIITTAGINQKIMSKIDGKPIKYDEPGTTMSSVKSYWRRVRRSSAARLIIKYSKTILKIIISSLIVTTAATVFSLPVVIYNFGALSLTSPLTNLAATPLITAILVLALLIMIFSFILFILPVFSVPVYYTAKLLLYITNYLGSFKYSYISVNSTNGTGFYILSVILLALILLCFIIPPMFAGTKASKIVKSVLYSSAVLIVPLMIAMLIYPRILFEKDSVRAAYYSDSQNQNIILFHNDYDSADIIDITHGYLSPVRPTYDIITQNGAMCINSIILTDYRKRHKNMIARYMEYSDIKKVYIPAPLSEYDVEVYNMLYYLSVTAGFKLINYGTSLQLDDNILITVNTFEYNKMIHTAIDINYQTENTRKKLLYLGIGYKEGYELHTDIKNNDYDIVFYGSHKHNRRDDDYVSDISGSYAGVLSSYLDGEKNITNPKLDASALSAYVSGSVLFRSDDYGSIVFELRKDGMIRHYLK